MSKIVSEKMIAKLFPKRKKDSHKGDNGRTLVIGGSYDYTGAPALAGLAAMASMRTGIDQCFVLAPEKTGFVINSYSMDLIVKKVSGKNLSKKHFKEAFELAGKCDAALIGNGAGGKKETIAFMKKFIQKCKKPLIVDADAFKACGGMKFKEKVLVTPHEKEFELFSGKKIRGKKIEEKIEIVKSVARKQNCIVLLKGQRDIITDGKEVFLNKTGNMGMTVGGTGDVLAGLCLGYASLGLNLFDSAKTAAFVNGKIGDKLRNKQGFSFLASDFIPEISHWTKKFSK